MPFLLVRACSTDDLRILTALSHSAGAFTASPLPLLRVEMFEGFPGLGGHVIPAKRLYRVDLQGRIRELRLRNASLSKEEIRAVLRLRHLQHLDLDGSSFGESLDVTSLPKLEVLQLRDTNITRLAGLPRLRYLWRLDVAHTGLQALESTDAVDVDLSGARLSDLSVLSTSRRRELRIDGLDFSAVKGLEKLDVQRLSLRRCTSVDLTRVRAMRHLLVLHLDGTHVEEAAVVSLQRKGVVIYGGPDEQIQMISRWLYGQASAARDRAAAISSGPTGNAWPTLAVLLCFAGFLTVMSATMLGTLSHRGWLRVMAGTIVLPLLLAVDRCNIPKMQLAVSVAILICTGGFFLIPLSIRLAGSRLGPAATFWLRTLSAMLAICAIGIPVLVFGVAVAVESNSLLITTLVIALEVLVLLATAYPVGSAVAWIAFRHRLRRRFDSGDLLLVIATDTVLLSTTIATCTSQFRRLRKPEDAAIVGELSLTPIFDSRMLHGIVPKYGTRGPAGIIVQISPNSQDTHIGELVSWLKLVHERTGAPIWLVGTTAVRPGRAHPLVALSREVPLTVHASKLRFMMLATRPSFWPNSVQGAIVLNRKISWSRLQTAGLDTILTNAVLPVAQLLRSVFAEGSDANRTDVALRAVEMTAAYFCYACALDARVHGDEDEAARIIQATAKPTFGTWLVELSRCVRRANSPLSRRLADALKHPAGSDFEELREALVVLGARDPQRLSPKLIDALDLLREARNTLTAHGPVSETGAEDLYVLVLVLAIETLARLPWDAAKLRDKGEAMIALELQSNLGSTVIADASQFFARRHAFAVMFRAGTNRMLDPVWGVQWREDSDA